MAAQDRPQSSLGTDKGLLGDPRDPKGVPETLQKAPKGPQNDPQLVLKFGAKSVPLRFRRDLLFSMKLLGCRLPADGPQMGPGGPQEAPRESPGTIRTHTDPYGHLSGQFSKCCWTYFGHFWKMLSKNGMVKSIFDENQSCSYFNSVQDALSIKFWGPYFDGFVNISIFIIWGSWGIQPLC